MKNLITIMKENSKTTTETIEQQKKQIEKLQKSGNQIDTVNEEILEKRISIGLAQMSSISWEINSRSHESYNERLDTIVEDKLKVNKNVNFYERKWKELACEIEELKGKNQENEILKRKYKELKEQFDEVNAKYQKKEEGVKNLRLRYSQVVKKNELIAGEKKRLEEKNLDLEADKKKMLEKWQR